MAKYKRYSGEFLSRGDTLWRVDIQQEAEADFGSVGGLRFPAESPLVIEWERKDKEEPVCGSVATLKVVSPGDRTYEDLYVIEPGTVRMDVYRNGSLYWSGTLDPEFYEEPYAYEKEYEVELTFSDFGILDRCKYTLSGQHTLQELTEHALAKAQFRYGSLDQSHITTSLTDGGLPMTLESLSLRSENFYDEDGEGATLYEMLEGILQPLGLRIQQRGGTVWVYDLNGLYTGGAEKTVEWADTDQTMGTDKVVNNVKITFSPYADSAVMEDKLEYGGEPSDDLTNLTSSAPSGDQEYYSYYPDYNKDWDHNNISFTIFLSTKGSGLAQISPSARYFHIHPMLGGTEGEGVACGFYTGGHGSLASGFPKLKLSSPASKDGSLLMRTNRIPIQKLDEADRKDYYLRLSMDMLLDARYNPFTDANDENESGNQGELEYRFNYVQVPVGVVLYGEDGTALYHYYNRDIYKSADLRGTLGGTTGDWAGGAYFNGEARLEWYNPDDVHYTSGVGGWKTNRHNVGVSTRDFLASFKKLEAGQYMPYPPEGGYLEVTVYQGVYIYERTDKESHGIKAAPDDWYGRIRWLLYKAPKVEIVKRNIVNTASESDDIEYNSVLNENAKEDLELDTICGTAEGVIPTAKGIYLRTDTGTMVRTLARAGRVAQVEQLLTGTLYSQYAGRKTLLAGTAALHPGGLCCYTEACQPGKRFVCLGETQDAIADESEMEMVELRPDEYKAENE